jgi:hypothetical protein
MDVLDLRRFRVRAPMRFRASAGLVALLALTAQLGSAVHLALVSHVACPDHGELVEVATPRSADRASDATRSAALALDSSPAAAHGHDHCAIATFRREQSAAPRGHAAALPVPRSIASLVHLPDASPPPAIALLSLAPKSSPPLV